MSKGKICLTVAMAALVSAPAFAAKERVVRFQNSVRVGYDDNIYQNSSDQGSGFITDIINLSGKLTFSSRSDMLLYWQPEFRYRFDADPNSITYQDLYGRFNHAVSQRTFLQVSDRFRYQDKEGQTGGSGPSGAPSNSNQKYMENNLMGSLDFTVSALSQIKVGGGYEFRTWDDSGYGQGSGNNDYDQYRLNGSYVRELRPNKTSGMVGLDYVDHSYDGSRGGFKSTTIYGGVDQNFSPNVIGTARLGYSFNNVDSETVGSSDSSSPYLQAGLEVNPTARTSFTGSLGYSMSMADNSVYNAQDRFNLGLGVRHDLTGKISLSSSLGYTFSNYSSDYSRFGISDAQDDYLTFNIRGSYQINRNNFVDAGYQFGNRSSDSAFLNEFTRNVFDIGWRLRL